MEKSNFYVYLLLDPRRLYLPFYVGKGKGKRWKDHMKDFNGKNPFKKAVIRKIRDAGMEPEVMIWRDSLTEDKAFELERVLIARFGRRDLRSGLLTNLTDGGEGQSGRLYSKEERERVSRRVKGTGNPMFGRTHSTRTRQEMSRQRRGKPGHKHSSEWKQYLQENNAGGKATARPVYQIGQDGKIIKEWRSMSAASKNLALQKSNISKVVNTHRKCGGYWWRFVGANDVIEGCLKNYDHLQKKLDKPKIKRAVTQLDEMGNVIKTWTSFTEAANSLDLKYATLWAAAKHQRLYGGYFWLACDSKIA